MKRPKNARVPHFSAADPTLCLTRVEGLPCLPMNFEDTEALELCLPCSLSLPDALLDGGSPWGQAHSSTQDHAAQLPGQDVVVEMEPHFLLY